MMHKIFFSIISILILIVLSLKKKNKKEQKGKIYAILIILGYISIIMHIFEALFFEKQLHILFEIAWYSHWISTYALFLLMFHYFLIYLNIIKIKNVKEVFYEKRLISLRNIYLIFTLLTIGGVIVYVRPISLTQTFEFVPFKYGIYILITMLLYGIFLSTLVFKFIKSKEENKKTKLSNMIITLMYISLGAIAQIIIPSISILSIGISLGLLNLNLFIEKK